ncbi:MAG: hypothetical protein JNM68_04045 [Dinghuibacter sp.]|nr:hypothetical protein [Dinghuibacter sp.]
MNKWYSLILFLPLYLQGGAGKYAPANQRGEIPDYLLGRFRDDYGITYTITRDYFLQEPSWKYHILKYDSTGSYFIVRNDKGNDWEPGKYSRIDISLLTGNGKYTWAYCLTTFDAATAAEAETKAKPNRDNLKKGCGGFPFSRMSRIR